MPETRYNETFDAKGNLVSREEVVVTDEQIVLENQSYEEQLYLNAIKEINSKNSDREALLNSYTNAIDSIDNILATPPKTLEEAIDAIKKEASILKDVLKFHEIETK